MGNSLSTFDRLVETLSSDEATDMLSKIQNAVASTEQQNSVGAQNTADFLFSAKNKPNIKITDEPFYIQILLAIMAFFKSSSTEQLHNEYLIMNLGRELKKSSSNYINITKNTYAIGFYEALRELRKTQLFFSGLLSAYDSEKGQFYMLASSFIAPNVYQNLMAKTDPFMGSIEEEASSGLKSNFFKSIDNTFSQLTEQHKNNIYQCAKAIEWMKSLCDISLDRILLRFNVISEKDVFCSPSSIQPEMKMLASVLNSEKKIPEVVIQSLFLLHHQDKIMTQSDELNAQLNKFVDEAVSSLKSIKNFIANIPLSQILRFVDRDITWQPSKFEGGEDWFIFFKHAWKERFNEKWLDWSSEQEKQKLEKQILSMLKISALEPLKFTPWQKLNVPVSFKREFSICFLKAFFKELYNKNLNTTLKVISVDGKFYRRENMTEFNDAYTSLDRHARLIFEFEELLSPRGEIGDGFEKLKSDNLIGLKYKNALDTLLRSMETNAKQLLSDTENALKSLYAVLTGVLTGGKTGIYATLSNRRTIKGQKNEEYIEELEAGYEQIKLSLGFVETLNKIER